MQNHKRSNTTFIHLYYDRRIAYDKSQCVLSNEKMDFLKCQTQSFTKDDLYLCTT